MLPVITFLIAAACSTPNVSDEYISDTLTMEVFLQSRTDDANYQFTAPRNFTFDQANNLYIFDYMENYIKKYDPQGNFITEFGKQGTGTGEFEHLMAIAVFQDTLYALDSIALLKFSLKGDYISIDPFSENAICDLPKIWEDGSFIGEKINPASLQRELTLYGSDGQALKQLAAYDLKEFFPDLEKEKDFFLNPDQTRLYLYDITPSGDIYWAASDDFSVYRTKNGHSELIISGTDTPLNFPEEQKIKLAAKQDSIKENMPELHMFVPERYQLLYQLFLGEEEDIWLYVKSRERVGFIRYTAAGKEVGFYSIAADFDMSQAKVQIFQKKIYILTAQRRQFIVYSVEY